MAVSLSSSGCTPARPANGPAGHRDFGAGIWLARGDYNHPARRCASMPDISFVATCRKAGHKYASAPTAGGTRKDCTMSLAQEVVLPVIGSSGLANQNVEAGMRNPRPGIPAGKIDRPQRIDGG